MIQKKENWKKIKMKNNKRIYRRKSRISMGVNGKRITKKWTRERN